MKRLGWPILVLLAVLRPIVIIAQPATSYSIAPLETTDSPNHKFRVVIEAVRDSAKEVQASMMRIDGDTPVSEWITHIRYSRRPYQWPNTYVSNKGEFFARITSSEGDVALFRKDHDAAVFLETTRFETSRFQPNLHSFDDRMPAVETLRGEEVLRLWDPDRRRWSAYGTKDAAKFHPSREDIDRWNESTRQEILQKLYAAQREELRQKATRISAPLARIAAHATTNIAFPRQADYEFLANLRNADDRKWFEALLEKSSPFPVRQRLDFLTHRDEPYYFECTDFSRARADGLLALWDKKTTAQQSPILFLGGRAIFRSPHYKLGQVSGTIRLPLPMPIYRNATQATFLHIRLIRADDKKRSDQREERISAAIGFERARDRREAYNAKFAFTTVVPGAYQLKAVWDKRHPVSDTNNAGPGDYETALSAPFTVTAGVTVTNLLFCTNRVSGGEAYYRADEILERQWLAGNPAAPLQ
jgi:hypothetical protein